MSLNQEQEQKIPGRNGDRAPVRNPLATLPERFPQWAPEKQTPKKPAGPSPAELAQLRSGASYVNDALNNPSSTAASQCDQVGKKLSTREKQEVQNITNQALAQKNGFLSNIMDMVVAFFTSMFSDKGFDQIMHEKHAERTADRVKEALEKNGYAHVADSIAKGVQQNALNPQIAERERAVARGTAPNDKQEHALNEEVRKNMAQLYQRDPLLSSVATQNAKEKMTPEQVRDFVNSDKVTEKLNAYALSISTNPSAEMREGKWNPQDRKYIVAELREELARSLNAEQNPYLKGAGGSTSYGASETKGNSAPASTPSTEVAASGNTR